MAEDARRAALALRSIPELDTALWKNLSPDQRRTALQQAESLLALLDGRPSCELRFPDSISRSSHGLFNPVDYTIQLRQLYLRSSTADAAVSLLAHESRHAFQYWSCYGRGQRTVDTETRELWNENFHHYQQPPENRSPHGFIVGVVAAGAALLAAQLMQVDVASTVIAHASQLIPQTGSLVRDMGSTLQMPIPIVGNAILGIQGTVAAGLAGIGGARATAIPKLRKYRNQPVEADANSFAAAVAERIYPSLYERPAKEHAPRRLNLRAKVSALKPALRARTAELSL